MIRIKVMTAREREMLDTVLRGARKRDAALYAVIDQLSRETKVAASFQDR